MKQLLGTGMLSWPNYERIAGRYGIIALFRAGNPEEFESGLQGMPWNIPAETLVDTHGSFLAVLEGQEYDLGSGTFFTELYSGITYVGLRPDVPREEDWLNVDNLYKVDWMLSGYKDVDLYFVQDEVVQAIV
jgi:hypothetical protein